LGDHKLNRDTVKGGLMGLALSSTQDENSTKLARELVKRLDVD
jgi:hypothetical protein